MREPSQNKKIPTRRISRWKKALFAVITVTVAMAVAEVGLRLAGVDPLLHREDPYVGFASSSPLFIEQLDRQGHRRMVTAPNKLRWFNFQEFAQPKPEGSYRIFCLGGSTTYGRPYDDTVSFGGWLRELLPLADRRHDWEVINVGGISYASYRIARLMEELIAFEPDLFIIYMGHNEFLERRTYSRAIEMPQLTELEAALSRTSIYTAAREAFGAPQETASEGSVTTLSGDVDPLLAHSIGPREYHRDDAMRERVLEHYRFNLERIIDMARSAGADVVLVTPASNLGDCSPFKSENDDQLSDDALGRFEKLRSSAARLSKAGRFDEALKSLVEAEAIDERYADLHYQKGRVLAQQGRWQEAKAALVRALYEDVCALRALPAISRMIRETAARKAVPLVDFAAVIEAKATNGIPGNIQFFDHVHLNLNGYQLLARHLVDKLEEERILKKGHAWSDAAVDEVKRAVEANLDPRAHGIAKRNLAKVYAWAGKLDEAAALAAGAIDILGDDAESYYTLATDAARRGLSDEAVRYCRLTLKTEPEHARAHNLLGRVLAERQDFDEAIEHFRLALGADLNQTAAAEAHHNMALTLSAQGKTDDAVHHFREALRLAPELSEGHVNLGNTLFSRGDLAAAIHHYSEGIRTDPKNALAYNNLGYALQAQGNPDEAIRHYRSALSINPEYAKAHYNLANTLQAQSKLDEAIRHYQNALRFEPGYAKAHYNLAVALETVGQLEEASKHFRAAASLAPDLPTTPQARD